MTIEKNQPKSGFKLAAAATLFTFVVIILGAFTRLVDAGLGAQIGLLAMDTFSGR